MQKDLYVPVCFIDYIKAFNNVRHEQLFQKKLDWIQRIYVYYQNCTGNSHQLSELKGNVAEVLLY